MRNLLSDILKRFDRVALSLAHDLVMAAAAFLLSLYLRLGDAIDGYPADFLTAGTATFVLAAGAAYLWTGLPRGVWRYASIDDLALIARAVSIAILLFLPAMFFWSQLSVLPRSTPFIVWFVLFALLAGPRLLYRTLREGRFDLKGGAPGTGQVQALLVGANDRAELFLQANRRRRRAAYFAVGILDDADRRLGREMGGVRVLGGTADLEAVVEALRARGLAPARLLIANPQLQGEELRALVDRAELLGMAAARLQPAEELVAETGGERELDVRPIAIEDLLGRPQTVLDRPAIDALIRDKRVLVTGAGGSIGSELVRQIALRGPAHLTLCDSSEFNLYDIDRVMAERFAYVPRTATIGDVRDAARMTAVFAAARPDIVFHAAALKHVPLLEANPTEGVLTNAIGTRNVADAAIASGAKVVVMISTDKAVNPTNVLGASKRVAEMLCQALDAETPATRFVTVRFGNVLASSGSVVPVFQRQLAAGGPLTVTHPDIKRYFMTIQEASELVLQACVVATNQPADERGGIMVLDMGEPVRIQDLARRMIRLAGKRPDTDVKIVFTGLRPGEKLNEELFHAGESLVDTPARGIKRAHPRVVDASELRASLARLELSASAGDETKAMAQLAQLVPEYRRDPRLPK